jgi:hypothetical protein
MSHDTQGFGFECLGFAMYCDNKHCKRRHFFGESETLEHAKAEASKRGLVIRKGKHYCDDLCRQEAEGLICQHVWPRGGPDAYVCIKCGKYFGHAVRDHTSSGE